MAKYEATLKDKDISVVTLAGKEYKAKDGVIHVDDDHHDAHKAAALIGLKHATEKPAPEKTSDKK
jgi:hypothetical protein